MTIRPHNRIHPISLVEKPRCYNCDGEWKFARLSAADSAYLELGKNETVLKCRSCGIVTMAIRERGAAERGILSF